MAAMSLRLPEDIDLRLTQEAEREGASRSDLARWAIAEFLARKERARFMSELVAEAQAGYADPALRKELLALAESGADFGLEDLLDAERSAGTHPEEKWWR